MRERTTLENQNRSKGRDITMQSCVPLSTLMMNVRLPECWGSSVACAERAADERKVRGERQGISHRCLSDGTFGQDERRGCDGQLGGVRGADGERV
jgi:hypothetical protein